MTAYFLLVTDIQAGMKTGLAEQVECTPERGKTPFDWDRVKIRKIGLIPNCGPKNEAAIFAQVARSSGNFLLSGFSGPFDDRRVRPRKPTPLISTCLWALSATIFLSKISKKLLVTF